MQLVSQSFVTRMTRAGKSVLKAQKNKIKKKYTKDTYIRSIQNY